MILLPSSSLDAIGSGVVSLQIVPFSSSFVGGTKKERQINREVFKKKGN